MSTVSAEFTAALERVQGLSSKPSNENLLKLYALYKQATEGDQTGDRPGGFDFKAMAKFDAWAKVAGKSSEEAQAEYIALVDSLA